MKFKSILSFFEKIKEYVDNFWHAYIKTPIYNRLIIEPRLKKERDKIIQDFEQKYKLSLDRVKGIMYYEKVYHENNPKTDYLNQQLVEGRGRIIKNSPFISRAPLFYNPETCEIHNETLATKKDDIHKIIMKDDKVAQELLKKQLIKAYSPNPIKKRNKNSA